MLGEGSGLLAGLTRGKNQLQFGSNYNWQLFDVFRLFCSRVGSKLTKCMENLGKKVFNFQNELQHIVFDTYVGLYWWVSHIGGWRWCSYFLRHQKHISKLHIGPTQVKCGLLISDIFYVMNFRLFLEMLEFDSWHFWKMSEIHCIKNARN